MRRFIGARKRHGVYSPNGACRYRSSLGNAIERNKRYEAFVARRFVVRSSFTIDETRGKSAISPVKREIFSNRADAFSFFPLFSSELTVRGTSSSRRRASLTIHSTVVQEISTIGRARRNGGERSSNRRRERATHRQRPKHAVRDPETVPPLRIAPRRVAQYRR